MDWPLRTKLQIGFIAVILIVGVLTVAAGSFLMRRMVVDEAQRRVTLGLKTARAMLDSRLSEEQHAAGVIAAWFARQGVVEANGISEAFLQELREQGGWDFLQVVDDRGVVRATARGRARGTRVVESPIVRAALEQGRTAAGVQLVGLEQLAAESPDLAAQAYLRVVETPRARPGGPAEMREAMVLEAAAPIMRPPGRVLGALRIGVLLNRNYELVDWIRDNIFTEVTYRNKALGTVTIFARDVRIATNVIGPDGQRAIGTQVSAEVYEQVLERGEKWVGPAFVVDSWYMSAYEPVRNPLGETIGILYVGVLKDRYDDMHREVMGTFLAIVLVSFVLALGVSTFLAGRMARPIMGLTAGAAALARGDLDYRLQEPGRAARDEIKRLMLAFNQMAEALKQRDEEIRQSHQELAVTAEELKRWNQNYLDTLEFITHELKNQVAAMKINLMALRDGYVGEITGEQREAMNDVVAAVNRTEEMILNYLNLSRIEKGELEVRLRPVHVEVDVVRPVLRDLKPRLDEKRMRVEVALPEDLVVQADPSLLQIVYENLVSNAAKYGREGGTIWFRGNRKDGFVELHVCNEGQGVPPDQLDELFRKFSRLHPPGEQERGTGLGLFITREIVRTHGGDIRAESEYGRWIDFIITLPRPDVLLGEELLDDDEV